MGERKWLSMLMTKYNEHEKFVLRILERKRLRSTDAGERRSLREEAERVIQNALKRKDDTRKRWGDIILEEEKMKRRMNAQQQGVVFANSVISPLVDIYVCSLCNTEHFHRRAAIDCHGVSAFHTRRTI